MERSGITTTQSPTCMIYLPKWAIVLDHIPDHMENFENMSLSVVTQIIVQSKANKLRINHFF